MDGFVRVAGTADIPDPGSRVVEVDGEAVALFHVGGAYHAIDDVCTHDGGPLASGELAGHTVACPRHGARFDIRTGSALSMPAVRATRCHEVRLADGGVWVRLRSAVGSTGPGPMAPVWRPPAPPTPFPSAAPQPAAPGSTTTAVPAAPPPTAPAVAPLPAGPLCEEQVRELLKAVKDPELFVNIVDLGLIYAVALSPSAEAPGKRQVVIDMTMTSPACPAGPQLIADTKRTLAAHPEVAAVEVRIVMDPPWTPDRMTDDARDQLGIF